MSAHAVSPGALPERPAADRQPAGRGRSRTPAHAAEFGSGVGLVREGKSWPRWDLAEALDATATPPGTLADVTEYQLDDDPLRVDLDAVWRFLSSEAYWGRWRARADIEKQVRGAWRVVGCYAESGEMVGFCRAISDDVALAYLADVFVEHSHRGRGLGKRLVKAMVVDGPGADFRWLLHTADAHELYTPLGFAPPDATLLEIRHVTTRGLP